MKTLTSLGYSLSNAWFRNVEAGREGGRERGRYMYGGRGDGGGGREEGRKGEEDREQFALHTTSAAPFAAAANSTARFSVMVSQKVVSSWCASV